MNRTYLPGAQQNSSRLISETRISSGTLTVDSRKVAILAALYIADELHQLQKVHEQADAQLATRSAECSEMLDRLLKAPRNLDRPAASR